MGDTKEAETEEERWVALLVEDCEAPLVVALVGDTVLCSAVLCSAELVGLERPDSGVDALEVDEGEEPDSEDDADEGAVLVALPEPLVEVETEVATLPLPVDDVPAFGGDHQVRSFG